MARGVTRRTGGKAAPAAATDEESAAGESPEKQQLRGKLAAKVKELADLRKAHTKLQKSLDAVTDERDGLIEELSEANSKNGLTRKNVGDEISRKVCTVHLFLGVLAFRVVPLTICASFALRSRGLWTILCSTKCNLL